jgi:hypothetical protein
LVSMLPHILSSRQPTLWMCILHCTTENHVARTLFQGHEWHVGVQSNFERLWVLKPTNDLAPGGLSSSTNLLSFLLGNIVTREHFCSQLTLFFFFFNFHRQ